MALLQTYNFADLITFTRASAGSYRDSLGVLQQAASGAPRLSYGYSGGVWAAAGILVEEQRTNLALYAADIANAGGWTSANLASITVNALTAPDGTLAMDKMIENAANATHGVTQAVTTVAASVYTQSIYAKADTRSFLRLGDSATGKYALFNLGAGTVDFVDPGVTATISDVGGGIYRCSVALAVSSTSSGFIVRMQTSLADAGAWTYAGDGASGLYVWGHQVELGAAATSYIPTTSAQVTRAADVPIIDGARFSTFFNPSAGTLYVEASILNIASGNDKGLLQVANGGISNLIQMRQQIGGNMRASFIDAGTGLSVAVSTANLYTGTGVFKAAVAWQAGDAAVVLNGGAVATAAPASIPSGITQLTVGDSSSGRINGHVRTARYYPTRLTNAELQALTA